MKVGVVSLGCSKNRVDTENLLGCLRESGFEITPEAAQADVIVVNTCGFIQSAKQESINSTLEMAKYKQDGACKLLVMCGCLSERYKQELPEAMPEVDLYWGVKDQKGLAAEIARRMGLPACSYTPARVLTTPPYSAYLRIADGCDNRCAYCAIPMIRGGRVSVPMEELIAEAERLAGEGVKELTLIAQDTSAYGIDIYGKPMLAPLMRALAKIEPLHWIRVLYTYPNTVDKELIDAILEEPKLINYLDMPIQHIDDDMLRSMNRHGSGADIMAILQYIRARRSSFILRTTLMVGFPGETEERFSRLTEFLQEAALDRVGAFAFSCEEGTLAASMSGQIPEDVKQARLDAVMSTQQAISLRRNQARIGRSYEVLTEGVEEDFAWGRSYAEAPEVDGYIRFKCCGAPLMPGDFTNVRITDAKPYDLIGEEIDK